MRSDFESEVGDHVFHKVSPTKGVIRFEKSQLEVRFIELFKILRKVGDLAYELALSLELSHLHHVFHISMLRKYMGDPSLILEYEPLQVYKDLSYE